MVALPIGMPSPKRQPSPNFKPRDARIWQRLLSNEDLLVTLRLTVLIEVGVWNLDNGDIVASVTAVEKLVSHSGGLRGEVRRDFSDKRFFMFDRFRELR
jgi:hypothetical protein